MLRLLIRGFANPSRHATEGAILEPRPSTGGPAAASGCGRVVAPSSRMLCIFLVLIPAVATSSWTCGGASGNADAPGGDESGDEGDDAGAFPDAGDDGRTEDGDDGRTEDGDADAGRPLEPEFVFNDPVRIPPCPDLDPIPVTAPAEVPDRITAMSLKWSYNLGSIDNDAFRIAERQDGAVCAMMQMRNALGCVSREGELLWVAPIGAGLTHHIFGGIVVTPQGEVVARSLWNETRAIRMEGPPPDDRWGGDAWSFTGSSPPSGVDWPNWGNPIPPPPIFVAPGGRFFHVMPWAPTDLSLFNRCGGWLWTIRNFVVSRTSVGGVMGDEILILGKPTPTHITEWRLYAIHVEGRMRVIEVPARRGGPEFFKAIGPDRFAGVSQVREGPGEVTLLGVRWFTADRDGTLLHDTFIPATRPWPLSPMAVSLDGAVLGVDLLSSDPREVEFFRREADGALSWSSRDRALRWGSFVLGRNGEVIATDTTERTIDGRSQSITDVVIFAADGREQDRLALPDTYIVPDGYRTAILAMDGTLYFVAVNTGGRGYSLFAVQTPVPGPRPSDPGWTRGWGRNSRGDNWAR